MEKALTRKIIPSFKVWLEVDGKPVVGRGGVKILQAIEKEGSIGKAAKSLGMSYRYVWAYLRRINKVLGVSVVESRVGGLGGGETRLTETGLWLVKEYLRVEKILENALKKLR